MNHMKPLELLIWTTGGDDSTISTVNIRNPAKAELKRLRKLEACAVALNEIVDGVRNVRWASPSGSLDYSRRLKDTPEWCAFYCALSDLKETAQ